MLPPGVEDSQMAVYRGVNNDLYVLLSRTQAGPGRTVKQESRKKFHATTYKPVFTSLYVGDMAVPKADRGAE